MGSMHTGLEEAPDGFARMAAFYAARARGGVGLIVTGGIAPNLSGRLEPKASQLSFPWQVGRHRVITDAVHAEGGKIALQILHAGRYAFHPLAVAPSASRSPISPFRARGLTGWGVRKTIADYARCAQLARRAGYDGVEIMGSEGYLINQFVAPKTNHRDDAWGGSFENRIRFPVEVVRRTRAAVGPDFIIVFRLSMLDLVEGGSTWDEVVALAQAVEAAGATIINTGIGWHEARIPTIATMVPRAAFAWVTRRMKGAVKIPLVTTNRINDPGHRGCGARARRRRHGVDGAAVPRRRRLRRQGRGRPRRRDQHVHRLQPGVPRPDLRARDRIVPRQSLRVPRDGADGAAARGEEGGRGGRRGAGGARRGDDGRGARPSRHAVRRGRGGRRPVQPRAAHSRQGGVRGDAALLPHAARAAGRRGDARPARGRRGPRGLRRRARRHGHRAAHAGDSRHRPPEGRELRRGRRGPQDGGGEGRDRRRGRHRLRRGGIPDGGHRARRAPERRRAGRSGDRGVPRRVGHRRRFRRIAAG